jgi:hypothetical protein
MGILSLTSTVIGEMLTAAFNYTDSVASFSKKKKNFEICPAYDGSCIFILSIPQK